MNWPVERSRVESVVASTSLISTTDRGLYCERGGFYIDPWRPVQRAVITHAHADHARRGNGRYLTSRDGLEVLQRRMGTSAAIGTVAYGEVVSLNGVKVSLHPAGHVLGSAQVRVEHRGETWVVSGDYKVVREQTCAAFEPVRCHTFITECTFGLPIYRWKPQDELFSELNSWWRQNVEQGRPSIVFAYALGKAQRVLVGVDATLAPIYCHGAVERVNADYRKSGVALPHTEYAGRGNSKRDWQGALVVAPPSALGTPWMRKFGQAATAFASGWMLIRGTRRRRSVERGFVVSDHADWKGLLTAIEATGAERILATHGQTGPLCRYLQERGLEADSLQTEYVGERDDTEIDAAEDDYDQVDAAPQETTEAAS
ncbi:MAG: ligase-associated DNA damage response exonuclease [Planctomycetota bacterium]|nr:MAG: ligase-associated DNA damage response exonuclease [Planctomycetota bacterium]